MIVLNKFSLLMSNWRGIIFFSVVVGDPEMAGSLSPHKTEHYVMVT